MIEFRDALSENDVWFLRKLKEEKQKTKTYINYTNSNSNSNSIEFNLIHFVDFNLMFDSCLGILNGLQA